MTRRCGCSIAPPDLLARLERDGTPAQRVAARRALDGTLPLRERRSGAALAVPRIPAERRAVYDVGHGGADELPGRLVWREGEARAADAAVNEAAGGAGDTWSFFQRVLGRDSIDGRGMRIVSCVHYERDFDNAFWDGSELVYGDGSGELFVVGALTKALDIIGHELTHGVTQATAGLRYSKQPGALNEHFSDVFGSLVKQNRLGQSAEEADWLIGEGALVPALGRALRSMRAPGTAFDGDEQPAHMDDYRDLPDDGDPRNDNGGVHVNSGIPNRAFHLAATAIGGRAWNVAGHVWYAALTERLGADSGFADAARATIAEAGRRFSSTERDAIAEAWETVGVRA